MNVLCACGCGAPAPLAKTDRPKDGIKAGQPLRFVFGHSLRVNGRRRGSLEGRFWKSVSKSNDCWLWTASVNTHGYGQIRDEKGAYTIASRVSWRLNVGDIPDGLQVLHRCDTPHCVRPDHLFLGTAADNVHDMDAKGRRGKRGAA